MSNDIAILQKENEELRKELEKARDNLSFLLAAMDDLPNPIFMKDADARFVFFNKRYSEFFSMSREKYIGQTVLDLEYLEKADRERYQKEDLALIKNNGVISYEADYLLSDGKKHPSLYWSRGILDKKTGRRGLVGEIVDISKERNLRTALDDSIHQLKATNDKLNNMAKIDAGTGIYNRLLLNEKANEFAEEGLEARKSCAIMADLDHFKVVNDKFGHIVGDDILSCFADILRTECREKDFPIRYGGDEFLVILSDATEKIGMTVAERIRKKCQERIKTPDGKPVTVSMGVAAMDWSKGLEAMISTLDNNLYLAKENGRNCVVGEEREE